MLNREKVIKNITPGYVYYYVDKGKIVDFIKLDCKTYVVIKHLRSFDDMELIREKIKNENIKDLKLCGGYFSERSTPADLEESYQVIDWSEKPKPPSDEKVDRILYIQKRLEGEKKKGLFFGNENTDEVDDVAYSKISDIYVKSVLDKESLDDSEKDFVVEELYDKDITVMHLGWYFNFSSVLNLYVSEEHSRPYFFVAFDMEQAERLNPDRHIVVFSFC